MHIVGQVAWAFGRNSEPLQSDDWDFVMIRLDDPSGEWSTM